MRIKRLVIVGLGLIGGSLGLALKKGNIVEEIVGVDVDPASLQGAPVIGAVHWATEDLGAALDGAQLVVVATPVGQIPQVFSEMAPYLTPETLVTDVGSSKGMVVAAAQKHLPNPSQYIGGHPMAGSEQGGIAAAHAHLFENAYYVLTPLEGQIAGLEVLRGLVKAVGAIPIIMSPEKHDQVVAATSHLPHLVAAVLVNTLQGVAAGEDIYYSLAAGGFRDTTRIAAGDPYLWRDIFFSNKAALLEILEAFEGELALLKDQITADSEAEVVKTLHRARRTRQTIPQRGKGILSPLYEIVITLVDKPGAICQVAFLLAEEGINIVDIEILRVREGEGGTLRLGLASATDVDRAMRVLQGAGFLVRER
ncbi:MAG: prephenate dehydrogenase/arogenate dehydrogenase family protein [Limnochordia bacterium]|jgi:prephenate dehydrogenase